MKRKEDAMADPQQDPLHAERKSNEQRPYLVQRAAEDRESRIAGRQVHDEERSSAENVIGWIVLSAAALTLLFAPSDMRFGGHMIEWVGGTLALIGVVLIGAGWITRRRLEEELKPKGE
jgi:hypothetical protein